MRFKEKVCVVTGGANGIGRCICEAFAKEGASIACLDVDKAAGEKTGARLEQAGADVLFFHGDAGDPEVLDRFAAETAKRFGRVDVLIHNACISKKGIQSGCSYEDFLSVLRVGTAAPYYLTKLLLPIFGEGASVVNISSTRAFQSQADSESYTAAKGGVTALTRALAVSLKGKARVNAIAPGWIDTGSYHQDGYVPVYTHADTAQHLSGRVGVPGDIARAALFLCDPRNEFITGECLTVDGGMTKRMIYAGDEGWDYTGE